VNQSRKASQVAEIVDKTWIVRTGQWQTKLLRLLKTLTMSSSSIEQECIGSRAAY
jgi:hypothetical protein